MGITVMSPLLERSRLTYFLVENLGDGNGRIHLPGYQWYESHLCGLVKDEYGTSLSDLFLTRGSVRFGRNRDAEIYVPDDDYVSRVHGEMYFSDEGNMFVEDRSRNGMLISWKGPEWDKQARTEKGSVVMLFPKGTPLTDEKRSVEMHFGGEVSRGEPELTPELRYILRIDAERRA